jgi:ACS family glucarate transporter-like MFS transporter
MIPKRYLFVAATFLLSFLLYVDRVCISTAQAPITADLKLSDEQFGWILSGFAFGYALFQSPAGTWADRRGARRLLTGVVVVWSVFTGLTAVAWNFVSLLVIRFLFGAGEAGAFPGIARAAYSWIPVRERGLVNGINFSASRLGAAVTMPLLPLMIHGFGWKASFIILMAVGCVWAGLWWRWFRDEPGDCPGISAAEKDKILANRPAVRGGAAGRRPLPLGVMLRSGNLWLLMLQYAASNFTAYFCLSWLFPYVQKAYRLSYTTAGFYTMVPLLAGAVGNVMSGLLVDRIYSAGHPIASRRWPACVGFGLAATGLVASLHQAGAVGAVAWLSVGVFGVDMILSPAWSCCIDIGGEHAGRVSGAMNMAGNLSSALAALAFPYLQKWTGGPQAFFYLGAGLNGGAAICWLFTDPTKKMGETA